MTFGNFILSLRRRLQDLRQTNGTLIDSFTDNGIRWSSARLIEISNQAFIEFARLIHLFVIKEFYEKHSFPFALSSVITKSDITISSGQYSFTDKRLPIALYSANGSVQYVAPTSYELVAKALEGDSETDYFTVYWDNTNNKYILETTAPDGSYTFTYIACKDDYSTADGSTQIKFDMFVDVSLDIAEKNAREEEGYWERAVMLEKRILYKIAGVLK